MRTQKKNWSRETDRVKETKTKGSSPLSSSSIICRFVFLLVVRVSLFLDGLSSLSQSVCVESRDTQAEQPEDKHAHGTPPAAPYASYL